ncbi:MAG: hypothetical protein ACP5M4_03870 [Acidobacteriaceae bacterium]
MMTGLLATNSTDEACTALQAAITAAKRLSPAAQKGYLPNLQCKLSKLPAQAATR